MPAAERANRQKLEAVWGRRRRRTSGGRKWSRHRTCDEIGWWWDCSRQNQWWTETPRRWAARGSCPREFVWRRGEGGMASDALPAQGPRPPLGCSGSRSAASRRTMACCSPEYPTTNQNNRRGASIKVSTKCVIFYFTTLGAQIRKKIRPCRLKKGEAFKISVLVQYFHNITQVKKCLLRNIEHYGTFLRNITV